LIDGTVVKKGGLELVDRLEKKGYKWILEDVS
jgi:Fe-S cluster assembly ATPase SufC